MHIAFAIPGNLELVSGGFVYDRALAAALAGLGHRVDVVSLPWLGYGRAIASGLFPLPPAWGTASPFDVIVEDELAHPSLWKLGKRCTRERSRRDPGHPPRVALTHNLRSSQPSEACAPLKALVEHRYLTGVDGIIAVCADTMAGVRTLVDGRPLAALVALPGRDHVHPNVDGEWVWTRSHRPGPFRILHVAALAPHKGLARLLEAVARLRDVDFQVDVVGSLTQHPRYVRRMNSLAMDLGLGGRVLWHGEQRGSDLWNRYRESHVMALPSDREAYALSCLEALGFGLPVVATTRGGLAEMFASQAGADAGVLLDPDDVAAWTTTLRALSLDRARLAERGRAALAVYGGHKTWRDVAINVQDFLSAVVDQSR